MLQGRVEAMASSCYASEEYGRTTEAMLSRKISKAYISEKKHSLYIKPGALSIEHNLEMNITLVTLEAN